MGGALEELAREKARDLLARYEAATGAQPAPDIDAKADARLRRILWTSHGHSGALYGDDGEMGCPRCGLDYKRNRLTVLIDAWERAIEERAQPAPEPKAGEGIGELLAEARREQMEADCRAVCHRCYKQQPKQDKRRGVWCHGKYVCDAQHIRLVADQKARSERIAADLERISAADQKARALLARAEKEREG